MGPIRCPETSVNNYHTTPCNNPEDHRIHHSRQVTCRNVLRMLRRAASWTEKRKTPHCYPAVLRRRLFILKSVNTDYKDGSSKPQGTEYICHIGTVPVSLDLGDSLEITGNQSCDGIFQGGCEKEGTVSLPTEQSGCSKNMQQSDTFCETPVRTTSPSSLSEPLDPKEQKCCSVLQSCTSQHDSESEMIIPHPAYLNQELSLDAAAVAVSIKQRSQMDAAEHWPMTDWKNDSLPANCYFPSYALVTPSVPAEHQEVNNCGFSSDTYQAQIINVAQQLSLADEVFEVEGDAEKYTELNSNSSYDMETFLREALGDELLATTQSEPELCHRNSLPSSAKGKGAGPESLFLTVREYRTLTELAKQKLRPTLPMIPILKPEEPVAAACPLADAQEKYKESLMQEVYTQKVLMLQCSKALSICKTNWEFHASLQRVEAERGLLLSSCRFQAAHKESKRLQYEQIECDVTEQGSVTISSISLSLKKDSSMVMNSDECVFWFVCIASHGKHVFATQATQGQQDNKLVFKEFLQFVGLPKDFVITLDVYTLQLQRVTVPRRERYRIGPKQQVGTVPYKLHHRDTQLLVSPYMRSVKKQPICTTSFSLIGSVRLKLADLHQQPPWILSKVPLFSPLTHEVTMILHSSLELKIKYSGFLAMMETLGVWQRRWCCLTGHVVRYWNYPHDWPDKPPLGEVDLRQSVSKLVGPVDRVFCPRPRTLLLEIGRPPGAEDCNTQETIVRHLWQADTKKELSEWCAKLTAVLCALKRWNIDMQSA